MIGSPPRKVMASARVRSPPPTAVAQAFVIHFDHFELMAMLSPCEKPVGFRSFAAKIALNLLGEPSCEPDESKRRSEN